jgi:hypothetical protein
MITAVIEFFALGTIGFYALLFVAALIITILEENEKGIWATITVLGTIGILQWGLGLLRRIPGHRHRLVIYQMDITGCQGTR